MDDYQSFTVVNLQIETILYSFTYFVYDDKVKTNKMNYEYFLCWYILDSITLIRVCACINDIRVDMLHGCIGVSGGRRAN